MKRKYLRRMAQLKIIYIISFQLANISLEDNRIKMKIDFKESIFESWDKECLGRRFSNSLSMRTVALQKCLKIEQIAKFLL